MAINIHYGYQLSNINILMDYLTKLYQNRARDLQRKILMLEDALQTYNELKDLGYNAVIVGTENTPGKDEILGDKTILIDPDGNLLSGQRDPRKEKAEEKAEKDARDKADREVEDMMARAKKKAEDLLKAEQEGQYAGTLQKDLENDPNRSIDDTHIPPARDKAVPGEGTGIGYGTHGGQLNPELYPEEDDSTKPSPDDEDYMETFGRDYSQKMLDTENRREPKKPEQPRRVKPWVAPLLPWEQPDVSTEEDRERISRGELIPGEGTGVGPGTHGGEIKQDEISSKEDQDGKRVAWLSRQDSQHGGELNPELYPQDEEEPEFDFDNPHLDVSLPPKPVKSGEGEQQLINPWFMLPPKDVVNNVIYGKARQFAEPKETETPKPSERKSWSIADYLKFAGSMKEPKLVSPKSEDTEFDSVTQGRYKDMNLDPKTKQKLLRYWKQMQGGINTPIDVEEIEKLEDELGITYMKSRGLDQYK
jgi:hypothetical protein